MLSGTPGGPSGCGGSLVADLMSASPNGPCPYPGEPSVTSANLICGMLHLTHQTDAADVDHTANSMVSIPYSFLWSFNQPTKHIPIMATGPCLPVQLSKLLPGTSSAFF